ncbi:saccharopine dehydrogenase C-terminal domain-containing protein [Hymenobacter weizhouensis]|uniref:saccharopine dehydrogenase C-terminal domain-containing protein n=1 Tax=Hymenobacter sp. YIM 151500-1 TaxID=2987689 RepID=UPI002225F141|nr:saccharopine dehydrogenase C-terminal domain-containing protein [Hymenobacter sp. YIM 151500-1]UYZ64339.1 saccharopine dehydrogenase NADP-binding domain-containing protein [Hymenobacter sp. YIM 151500-1]
MSTRLLLLGAGRSASALIDYLLRHAPTEDWQLTVADVQPSHLAPVLAAHAPYARAVAFDVHDETLLDALVAGADIVISMLPALWHGAVAQACLRHRRHLATASYVSEEIRALDAEARAAGVTLLMECGLDPGLDHMSAMRVLHEVRARGGRVTAFRSYCGGLLAPGSEGDNPWRYKFTWNPRNVVLAGQGTAKYVEDGHPRYIPYQQLFARTETLEVPGYGTFEGYANRDSLSYQTPYGLEGIPTMLRGTLRRPGYCAAWHALVRLGLTDDTARLGNSADLTWAALVESYLPAGGTGPALPARLASYLGLSPTGPELERLHWLGLFTDTPVGLADATPAQLLERLLTARWALQPGDQDMIVMQHQFGYELAGQAYRATSSLVVLGDVQGPTAMAKTVGLPLGMAVRRLAQGQLPQRGVVIPTLPDLYEPILRELEQEYEIRFVEEKQAVGQPAALSR